MKTKNLIYYIATGIAIILLYNYFKKGNLLPANRVTGEGKIRYQCRQSNGIIIEQYTPCNKTF
jgi:hypothetical protein